MLDFLIVTAVTVVLVNQQISHCWGSKFWDRLTYWLWNVMVIPLQAWAQVLRLKVLCPTMRIYISLHYWSKYIRRIHKYRLLNEQWVDSTKYMTKLIIRKCIKAYAKFQLENWGPPIWLKGIFSRWRAMHTWKDSPFIP